MGQAVPPISVTCSKWYIRKAHFVLGLSLGLCWVATGLVNKLASQKLRCPLCLCLSPPATLRNGNLQLFFWFFCFYLGFGGTGCWTHSLTPNSQSLYHLNHASSPFYVGCFSHRVSLYVSADQDLNLPIFASHLPGMTGPHHHTKLLLVKWVSQTLYMSWEVPLIFASQVARMTGLSHSAQMLWLLWRVWLFLNKSNNHLLDVYDLPEIVYMPYIPHLS
jgi:hypothetical protein